VHVAPECRDGIGFLELGAASRFCRAGQDVKRDGALQAGTIGEAAVQSGNANTRAASDLVEGRVGAELDEDVARSGQQLGAIATGIGAQAAPARYGGKSSSYGRHLVESHYMENVHPLTGRGGAARPFRFGVVAAAASSGADWVARARRIESLGYATLVIPDNLRFTLAPLPALAMAAAATRSLRVGTYVLANDLRHPVLLAKDVATLDLLSGGRFELGIGAGRPDSAAENRMLGLSFDAGGVRVARLAESLIILKALLAGRKPSSDGTYYQSAEADVSPLPAQQPHVPVLVAGSGRQMLNLAAREADIIALGLPPDATEAMAAERIDWIRAAAGERFSEIELNVHLMAVGDQVPSWMAARMHVTARDLADRGSVAAVVGSVDQMCEQLIQRRERLGFSYMLVSDELMEPFAPVVERLAAR
jgi:probable F420-dependent oxidoreductase